MKLIVGLGNPEPKYNLTRHNVGFWAVEQCASLIGASFTDKPRHRAEIAEFSIGDERIMLLKPTTYYNLAGEAVRSVMDFYKIAPTDILIIHDELSLPFGTVRTREGGSDAGNNGVKSINSHVGQNTKRIRVGISNDKREYLNDADFVLSKFTNDEIIALTKTLPTITEAIDAFISDSFVVTTKK